MASDLQGRLGEPSHGDDTDGHLRRALVGTKALVRIAYRDPEHVPERLTLHATRNLAEPSRAWAESARRDNPDVTPHELAEELRIKSGKIARIDGAVAGTPFFVALVPGYMSYLWQEARMTLRTAALFDHDPSSLRTAAEVLALRGVHPTPEAAEAALRDVVTAPPPVAKRRTLRQWVKSVRQILVFGGFLGPSDEEHRDSSRGDRLRAAGALLFGVAIWATTWIVPVTFMIALAWGCETHARQLGDRTIGFYGGADRPARPGKEKGQTRRQLLRGAALTASVAIPIGFVAYANHVRQSTGINWIGAVGALVALSLVVAGAVYGSRR